LTIGSLSLAAGFLFVSSDYLILKEGKEKVSHFGGSPSLDRVISSGLLFGSCFTPGLEAFTFAMNQKISIKVDFNRQDREEKIEKKRDAVKLTVSRKRLIVLPSKSFESSSLYRLRSPCCTCLVVCDWTISGT